MTLGFFSITMQEYIERNKNVFSYIDLALQLSPVNASMTRTSSIPQAVRGVTKGFLHQRRFELKDTIRKTCGGFIICIRCSIQNGGCTFGILEIFSKQNNGCQSYIYWATTNLVVHSLLTGFSNKKLRQPNKERAECLPTKLLFLEIL